MKRLDIERYKLEFEQRPDSWKSYGTDLVDAGSHNPCHKSPIARKVLGGRWQEAYQDWLAAGEFSRESEELMLAFILATEVVFHHKAPAAIPADLPKRVWSDSEYEKCLRLLQDVRYWNQSLAHYKKTGKHPYYARVNAYARLLEANKGQEAEAYYREHEMDQYEMAEHDLAMAKTCAHAHGVVESEERASKTKWFYMTPAGLRSEFPISGLELKKAFDTGAISRTTSVWREGMSGWQPATFLKEFQTEEYTGALPPALPALK
jgi:hypothetical protein